MNQEQLLGLIDGIYQAGMQPERWSAVLEQLADAMGAQDAALGVISADAPPMLVSPRTPQDFLVSYATHYHPLNLFWQRLRHQPRGSFHSEDMLLSSTELHASRFFNEWSAPLRYRSVIGATIAADGDFRVELQLPGRNPFEREHVDALNLLAAHLARSSRISALLGSNGQTRTGLFAALDKMGKAALVLDRDARLLDANETARDLLNERILQIEDTRLVAASDSATRGLHRLLSACADGGLKAETSAVLDDPDRRGLTAMAIPLAPQFGLMGNNPRILLIVSQRRRDDDERFRRFGRHHGLTSAELALLMEIARGDGRAAAARRRGVSDATARSQLSAIFDKTGLRRQAELMRALHEFD